MRDLRPRRDLAWQAHGADPRSHQRNPRRPPAREPEDSLSQLRRDTRYALLSEEPSRAPAPRVPLLRRRVLPEIRPASILLAGLRPKNGIGRGCVEFHGRAVGW